MCLNNWTIVRGRSKCSWVWPCSMEPEVIARQHTNSLRRAPISPNEHGMFFPLLFDYGFGSDTLKLYLPDGRIVEGPAAGDGTSFSFDYYGMRNILVTPLDGPWQDVLSSFAERPIRLVRCVTTGTGIDILPITIVSTASIKRLE